MAFVHCHKCRWEQDDFWSLRGYNPVNFYVRQVLPSLWRWPKNNRQWTWRDEVRHQAKVLWRAVNPRTYLRMRWWSYQSWKRAIAANGGKWPPCPQCGAHLCID